MLLVVEFIVVNYSTTSELFSSLFLLFSQPLANDTLSGNRSLQSSANGGKIMVTPFLDGGKTNGHITQPGNVAFHIAGIDLCG